jgi:hypothetical protein
MLDIVRTCCHVVRTSCINFPNSVDCWNPTPCRIGEAWPSVWTVLLWCLDVFNAEASRHFGESGRLQRPVWTVAQEMAVLTWKLHEIFMDTFLETCGHTHGMKWDTVHITWRLWIDLIILFKSVSILASFCVWTALILFVCTQTHTWFKLEVNKLFSIGIRAWYTLF